MSVGTDTILALLDLVAAERQARRDDRALGQRVTVLKVYQQARFARTHAAALTHPDFRPAAKFFLEELYGPQDFTERDAQFARIVPAITRLFPGELAQTVACLASLHALSEQLDTAMGACLDELPLTAARYMRAWKAVGRREARLKQLELALQIGRTLQRLTRSRWLRQSLKLMRGPAQTAGLGELQNFLQRGFDTFAALNDSSAFLGSVQHSESIVIQKLFDAPAATSGKGANGAPWDTSEYLP